MSLTAAAKLYLQSVKLEDGITQAFKDSTITDIEKCDALVDKLNKFLANDPNDPLRHTEPPTIIVVAGTVSGYNIETNQITIGEGHFSGNQHFAVTNLAHEVGHARSENKGYVKTTVQTHAASSQRWEAEAVFPSLQHCMRFMAEHINFQIPYGKMIN